MPNDIFPRPDSLFLAFVQNFVSRFVGSEVSYGETAPVGAAIDAAATAFETAYNDNIAAQAAAQAARQDKDDSRAALETLLREVVGRMQANPAVDDGERESLGIRVYDTERTTVNAPTSRPVGQVDTSQRFEHEVSFRDELTPTSMAKPAGVRACQLFLKIGGVAPVDASECDYIATDTKSPYTYTFDGEDANQTAHWMLRWESTRGETGPWSETVSATIPG
jgi:hypothetical protein